MSYLEDTRVDLEVQPRPTGKLPEVRLKNPQDTSKNETLAELVTNLILHKYQKILGKLNAVKASIIALPPVQSIIKAKNQLTGIASKYKEKGKTMPNELKAKMTAQMQANLTKFQRTTKMQERLQGFKNKFKEKAGQVKEDIKEIQEQVKDIVRSAAQGSNQPRIK